MDSRFTKEGARRARRAVCAAFLLALAACGSKNSGSAKAFHVVLISMDGVQVSDATPNLAQLAKGSTGFESLQARDGSPLARTSTLLTGLLPGEHGAGIGENGDSVLDAAQTPLPEYLIDHGYLTGAIVASDQGMSPETGMNQGFTDYQTLSGSATDLAVLAEGWLDTHWRQPFFLFVSLPPATDAASPAASADQGEPHALMRGDGFQEKRVFDQPLLIGHGRLGLVEAKVGDWPRRDDMDVNPVIEWGRFSLTCGPAGGLDQETEPDL